MLIKEKSERNTLEMVSLEGLVPQDHLLWKIEKESYCLKSQTIERFFDSLPF